MTFSEYAQGLSPYISYGKSEADYFTELIGNFILDAAMDSCGLLKHEPDTKYRYITGKRQIKLKHAQYLYDHRDLKKFSSWIEERMSDTESYDKIEEWLNQKGISDVYVPDACANLLESVILGIINPAPSTNSDVQLPSEIEGAVSGTVIDGTDVSQTDKDLLQAFHTDYDKIIKQCISDNYADIWIAGNISKQITSLYTEKWSLESNRFLNLMLRSCVIETLGLLQQMCDILNPNTEEMTITAFRPSVRKIRFQLRNNYVKLHPDEYAGVFPYEAFVPDWADGEE